MQKPLPQPRGPPSVLVVDDVAQILHVFRHLLRRVPGAPVEVHLEDDARRALSLVRERAFHVILCDYDMPHAKGTEVLAAAYWAHPAGWRVLMSGYNELPASHGRLAPARLHAFLPKPFQAKVVLAEVGRMLASEAPALPGPDPPA